MPIRDMFLKARVGLVVLVPIVLLAPFLQKAFAVDDTVFVWVARQIHAHPGDFFGFSINWGGIDQPAYDVDKNPPGVSYYIALISALFGEREFVLHLFFLIPAIAVSAGSYLLAKRFCREPVAAALCAVVTPAFVVSSSSVMSDTMMVAFFIWSVALWARGIDRDAYGALVCAGFLAGCAGLTKYFGMSLVPLLFAYGLLRKRRLGFWCLPLLVPVVMMGAYQAYTYSLYGQGMFIVAVQYAADPIWRAQTPIWYRACIGLTFAGGCFAVVLFFAPFLWSWRTLVAGGALAAACVALIDLSQPTERTFLASLGAWRFDYLAHWWLFLLGGISIIALTGSDLWRSRDATSGLLFLWVMGTFCFSTFLNWTINARTMLPMAPAIGILVMRRLETAGWKPERWWRVAGPLVAGAALALCVAWGDYAWANSERDAARQLHKEIPYGLGRTYFSGHWGFQYYMSELGDDPFSLYTTKLANGDLVVVPENNTNLIRVPEKVGRLVMTMQVPACRWLSTMDKRTGTGFYLHDWGCLPFFFGPVPPELYEVYQVNFAKAQPEKPYGAE